jgi:hypothetical protein
MKPDFDIKQNQQINALKSKEPGDTMVSLMPYREKP